MPQRHTVREVALASGAKGLIVDIPDSPTVFYAFAFRGGYLYRGEAPFETPHLLEHLLYGVSTDFPTKAAFRKALTRHAAWSNAYTNLRAITHVGDAVRDDWLRVLDLRATAITKPLLRDEDITPEQRNVTEELSRNLTDTGRIAYKHMLMALGIPECDDSERIDRLTQPIARDVLERHYALTHTARNMRFVVAGDMRAIESATLANIDSWSLPSGERLPLASVALRRGRHTVAIPRGTDTGTRLEIGLAIRRLLTPHETVAVNMLLRFLCNGLRSRILARARDEGVCYQMNGFIEEHGEAATVWVISAPASVVNAPALMTIVGEEIARFVTEGMTDTELQEEKDYARGLWYKSGQTPEQLLAVYELPFVEHDRVRTYNDEPQEIDAVTADDVTALAREFVTSGISASVVVTKSDDPNIATALSAFNELLDEVH